MLLQLLVDVSRILELKGIQIKVLLEFLRDMLLQEMPGIIQVLEDLDE